MGKNNWDLFLQRIIELDRLFIRIYEDNAAGRVSDERSAMMSRNYEDEQEQLKAEVQTSQQKIEVQERQIQDLEPFIKRERKYADLKELTPYALRKLVKAIYIGAPDKSSDKRRQEIRIEYDLVGYNPLLRIIAHPAFLDLTGFSEDFGSCPPLLKPTVWGLPLASLTTLCSCSGLLYFTLA